MLDKPKSRSPIALPKKQVKNKRCSSKLNNSFSEDNEVFFNYQIDDRNEILSSLSSWSYKNKESWDS